MKLHPDKIKIFLEDINKLRYKTGLIIIQAEPQSLEFRDCLSQLDYHYIDVLNDFLPNISEPLGAYDNHSFIKDIETIALEISNIIIDYPEPLLATFGEAKVSAFFLAFSRLETRSPVILLTHLDRLIDKKNFTQNRILFI